MVVSRVDRRPVQMLSAGHVETVFKLSDLGPHGPQILRNECDAVGLLHAQFFCVADADAAAGVGADRGQHRQLVDELRGQRA